MRTFRVFNVGWEPEFIRYLLAPIAERTGIEFTHGIVGDSRRTEIIRKEFSDREWIALSKSATEQLPTPDTELLASLESVGVPTIRSMIQGDRVLRHRRPEESLGYATLLARRLTTELTNSHPDLVLGSFDSLHSALSLAVAKSLLIPWVAMTFTVIPDNLTAFCRGMTPETILPIGRPVDERLRTEAREVFSRYRSKTVKVLAYRPPESLTQRARQTIFHGKNLLKRISRAEALGVDEFTYPTVKERLADISRRSINRRRLPTKRMLRTPPDAPFLFFPLHMAPESSVDTWAPMYQNQLELAFQLALAAPANLDVVVKLHFSDPDNYSPSQLQRLMQLPRVRIAHPGASSRAFIERASLVVGIQGTASLEAALLGKPVLLFGDSPYQHFPRSERAKRPDALHGQIRRMLETAPAAEEEIVEAFADYMSRYMPGRINDWGRPIDEEDFQKLAQCFVALRSYVQTPGTRESWYDHPPFLKDERQIDAALVEESLIG